MPLKDIKKRKEWAKKWYKKNRLIVLEKQKKFRNSKEGKEYIRKWDKESPKRYFSRYKYSSKTRKNPCIFSLSFEQFISFWQKSCNYCGSEIKTIGLDRIDNNKGYIMENVCPCCRKCNIMKSNYTQKDFINHCKKIAKCVYAE